MVKRTKRLSYKDSYRNFIIKHTCMFILRICGIGGYCFVVIFPSVYVLSKSLSNRPQMIFAFVIPLAFTIFAGISCIDVKRYGQEIVRLLLGNFLVKAGCIVEKSRNVYMIEPLSSKKKQTKFEHLSYPNFYIKDKDCEISFQIGDYIKIIYPCSPKLSVRTAHQLYAIYAFSSNETYSTSIPKSTDREVKKTILLFLLVVALLSTFLLFILFLSINVLLKLIHIYP